MKKKTFHDRNKREKNEKHGDVFLRPYFLLSLFVTPHSFIAGLKPSVYANPFHRSLLFLLQDRLHVFPGLFTDTSEHIRFTLFSFLFSTFSCWFRALD